MKKSAIAALMLAATCDHPVLAQQAMKPEDQIKMRKSTMDLIGYNFGSLGAMAEGKKPFDKEEAQRNAELVARLVALAEALSSARARTSRKARTSRPSRRSGTHRADFDKKMETLATEGRQAARRWPAPTTKPSRNR